VRYRWIPALGALLALAGPPLTAVETRERLDEPPVDEVGIDQHIDAQVPLDLEFRDEQGRTVRLGDFFDGKPVILSLAYFRCPMLCTLVLNGMASSMGVLELDAGKDYEAVTVSIDPRETPAMAAEGKKNYIKRYGRPGAEKGWHFLTGEQESIDRLADAVGFRYVYDEETDQFAHASGIMVLTPDGRLARYFFGVEYSPRDLRLSLVEASHGKVGSVVDKVLLLCYQYDPATGTYGVVVYRVLRLAGVITIAVIALFVILMLRRDARLARRRTV